MRRSPAFSLIVILTFALGIGANTAIFSVVHAVLLEPLPYPGSERLVWLGESVGRAEGISVTWPNFESWRSDNRSLRGDGGVSVRRPDVDGQRRSAIDPWPQRDFRVFRLLGMQPLLGRLFTDQDDRPSAAPTIVLNHRFWSSVLGGDPQIVGATLTLDGRAYEVVGVAAPVWETRPVDYYMALGRLVGAPQARPRPASAKATAARRSLGEAERSGAQGPPRATALGGPAGRSPPVS